jgi:hypothetical protein
MDRRNVGVKWGVDLEEVATRLVASAEMVYGVLAAERRGVVM